MQQAKDFPIPFTCCYTLKNRYKKNNKAYNALLIFSKTNCKEQQSAIVVPKKFKGDKQPR